MSTSQASPGTGEFVVKASAGELNEFLDRVNSEPFKIESCGQLYSPAEIHYLSSLCNQWGCVVDYQTQDGASFLSFHMNAKKITREEKRKLELLYEAWAEKVMRSLQELGRQGITSPTTN